MRQSKNSSMSQRIGWVFHVNVQVAKNIINISEGEEESGLSPKAFIEWKEVTGLEDNKERVEGGRLARDV